MQAFSSVEPRSVAPAHLGRGWDPSSSPYPGRRVSVDPAIARRILEAYGTYAPARRRINSRRAAAMLPSGAAGPGRPAVPFYTPMRMPFSQANGAAGGQVFEVVRNTSAASASPTQQNEFLVGVLLEGGATPGAWEFLWDGTHQSILPVGASGLDATGAIGPQNCEFVPLSYGPIGTSIPAAVQTYGGGLAAVSFVFSNRPNPLGYRISAFTGVFVTGNESGTGGTARTYAIPGALGKPTGIIAHAAIEAGTATGFPIGVIQFPAIGNYAVYSVPAVLGRGNEIPAYAQWPIPDYDPASSFSLTHLCRSLGGATDLTIAGSLYYRQALQRTAQA